MCPYMDSRERAKNSPPMKAEIVPARTSRELVRIGQVSLPVAIAAAQFRLALFL